MQQQRLDKMLAGQLNLSRGDAKKLIAGGAVHVDGVLVRTADCKIDPAAQQITVSGSPLAYRQHIYIMLNKPVGVVSASRDARQKTVLDLIPPQLARKGLFPAGRLDKDTTGFVLITDDGALAHRMLSPRSHVPKTYQAVLDDLPGEEELDRLSQGVDIGHGVICRPARVRVLADGQPNLVEIIITEGMYHQVKRMFEAVGGQVLQLKRVKIGGLSLDEKLCEGGCKEIIHKDVEKLLTRDF
ncbi:MAG: pseudouridine synthase [Acetanaerobacterium sp.]